MTQTVDEVDIDKVVPGGLGLARTDEGIVLVRGALSGERVALTTVKKKRGTRYCYDYKVVKASDERVPADCKHHPECGGCGFLNFSAAAQVDAKHAMVIDALTRTGRIPGAADVVEAVVPADISAGARRRCRLRVDHKGKVGFTAAGSNAVVPLESCVALTGLLQGRIRKLSEIDGLPAMRLRLAQDDRGHVSAAVEEANDKAAGVVPFLVEQGICDGAIWLTDEGEVLELAGDPLLLGEIAHQTAPAFFSSDAACFTQATRGGGLAIAREVQQHLKDALFEGGPIVELFAGAGHLTLGLCEVAESVVAIEGAPHSAQFLRRNVDRYFDEGAGKDREENVRTLWGHIDGETFPSQYASLIEEFPEALVMDPPRTGINQVETLIDALEPGVVVMVSCDVATGARDLRAVMARGYRLLKVTPIDAFPRTPHVEWVASLIFDERLAPADDDDDDDDDGDERADTSVQSEGADAANVGADDAAEDAQDG